MKGYLVLCEGRSGSNWLGSMANNTGLMGYCNEFLGFEYLDRPYQEYTTDQFHSHVMQSGCTPNGRFATKVFPRHLKNIRDTFKYDFVQKCVLENGIKVIVLLRRSTINQAISLARGRQTKQWTTNFEKKHAEYYDYEEIRDAYSQIVKSNEFWSIYLKMHQMDYETHYYEDLLPDPAPYLNAIAGFLGVEPPAKWNTHLKIQRDHTTDEWRERFLREAKDTGFLDKQ